MIDQIVFEKRRQIADRIVAGFTGQTVVSQPSEEITEEQFNIVKGDFLVFLESDIQRYISDVKFTISNNIQKGQTEISPEMLVLIEKANKDISHLVKKVVVNKKGQKQTVYIDPNKDNKQQQTTPDGEALKLFAKIKQNPNDKDHKTSLHELGKHHDKLSHINKIRFEREYEAHHGKKFDKETTYGQGTKESSKTEDKPKLKTGKGGPNLGRTIDGNEYDEEGKPVGSSKRVESSKPDMNSKKETDARKNAPSVKTETEKKVESQKKPMTDNTTHKVGDSVKVNPQITSDPNNRKGQTGKVVKVEGDTAHVKFDDGKIGKYNHDTLDKQKVDEFKGLDVSNIKTNDKLLVTPLSVQRAIMSIDKDHWGEQHNNIGVSEGYIKKINDNWVFPYPTVKSSGVKDETHLKELLTKKFGSYNVEIKDKKVTLIPKNKTKPTEKKVTEADVKFKNISKDNLQKVFKQDKINFDIEKLSKELKSTDSYTRNSMDLDNFKTVQLIYEVPANLSLYNGGSGTNSEGKIDNFDKVNIQLTYKRYNDGKKHLELNAHKNGHIWTSINLSGEKDITTAVKNYAKSIIKTK